MLWTKNSKITFKEKINFIFVKETNLFNNFSNTTKKNNKLSSIYFGALGTLGTLGSPGNLNPTISAVSRTVLSPFPL